VELQSVCHLYCVHLRLRNRRRRVPYSRHYSCSVGSKVRDLLSSDIHGFDIHIMAGHAILLRNRQPSGDGVCADRIEDITDNDLHIGSITRIYCFANGTIRVGFQSKSSNHMISPYRPRPVAEIEVAPFKSELQSDSGKMEHELVLLEV
jgi:hypothetical protein